MLIEIFYRFILTYVHEVVCNWYFPLSTFTSLTSACVNLVLILPRGTALIAYIHFPPNSLGLTIF